MRTPDAYLFGLPLYKAKVPLINMADKPIEWNMGLYRKWREQLYIDYSEKFARRYTASGTLRYDPNGKVYLEVDPELVRYYRSLIPKSWNVGGTRYGPHITVVRVGLESAESNFGYLEGQQIAFEYENIICTNDNRYWLNCYSRQIEEIRTTLGLNRFRDGYKRYHITIGRKNG